MEENNQVPVANEVEKTKVIDQVTPVNTQTQAIDTDNYQGQEPAQQQPKLPKQKSTSINFAVIIGVIAMVLLIAIALFAYKKSN
jgi:isochorismate hydrolase